MARGGRKGRMLARASNGIVHAERIAGDGGGALPVDFRSLDSRGGRNEREKPSREFRKIDSRGGSRIKANL